MVQPTQTAVTYQFDMHLETALNGYSVLPLITLNFPRNGILIAPNIEDVIMDLILRRKN